MRYIRVGSTSRTMTNVTAMSNPFVPHVRPHVRSYDAAFQSYPLTRGSQRLAAARFGILDRILNRIFDSIFSTGSAFDRSESRSSAKPLRRISRMRRGRAGGGTFYPRGTKRSPHGIRAMTWEGRKFRGIKNSR